MYLLDSEWVVDFVSNRRQAVELVNSFAREELALSTITVGEVLEGLLGKSLPERYRTTFEDFVTSALIFVVDERTAREYAKIRAHLRSTGNLIPENDLWIAATALAYDLTLVSRDGHFQRVEGLRVY
ncbi:MAG: PIN domain-containing protein [Chloroflexi bacterium]|nr:PIN domain-containing protein [Chloroflexota bacterium]